MFASIHLALAENNSSTDYVRYVINLRPGSLEIEVLDNDDNNIKVANARVSGEIGSGVRAIDENTDADGKLIIENLEVGTYSCDLAVSASGYENRTFVVDNFIIEADKVTTLKLRLGYDPFDMQLGENSGSLTRGWVENRYYLLVTENRLVTRQIVTAYRGEPSYGPQGRGIQYPSKLYTSQVPRGASYNSSFWEGFLKNYYDTIYGTANNPFRREVRPNPFQDFTRGSSTYYLSTDGSSSYNGKPLYTWQTSPQSGYLETARGFKAFQGFYSSWATMPVYEGIWYIPKYYVSAPTYYYEIDDRPGSVVDSVVTPIYGTEQYTIYINTRYEIVDHALDNWSSKQTTVTATPRNGYTDSVKLSLEFDNGIEAALGSSELHFSSPATTTLTLRPKPDTHGSPHSASLKAYDSNGRLVIGTSRKPSPRYSLDTTTQAKPPTENRVIEQWESETKPDEQGQSDYIPSPWKQIGARGGLYDASTGQLIMNAIYNGGNVVSTITSKYQQGSFTRSGMDTSTTYNHSSPTPYSDEVWTMKPIKAWTNTHKEQTKSTTVGYNNVNTVDFSLSPYSR
jgi:hypothetical protein